MTPTHNNAPAPGGDSREAAIACTDCGTPTRMLGTKLCDNCWEVQRRTGYTTREIKEAMRLMRATPQANESTGALREAVQDHIRELTKVYQPAPFMDGSRKVPPSIEKLLRRLEQALAAHRGTTPETP